MIDETFDYPDYLAVKHAIDSRSLAQNVWQTLAAFLKAHATCHDFRILDIGAGTGSMLMRLLDADLLRQCQYYAVEREPGFEQVAEKELAAWAEGHGCRLEADGALGWTLQNNEKRIDIKWLTTDIGELDADFEGGFFDLLIGHAVIDLLPVPECLPGLLNLIKPGGGYYFSLNFAGVTRFLPADARDREITELYHRDMDRRFPKIDWRASQTGKLLGPWLKEQGHQVLAEGISDWQIAAASSATAAENRFIGNILATLEKALAGLDGLDDWIRLRRQQAASGKLLFFAANRDYFGRTCPLDPPQGKHSNQQNNRIT